MKADNYNRNYMLWGSRILNRGQRINATTNPQAPAPGYVDAQQHPGQRHLHPRTPRASTASTIRSRVRAPESSSNFISGDFQWDVNDKFRLSGQVGTSTGHGKTPTQDVAEWDVGLGSGAGWQPQRRGCGRLEPRQHQHRRTRHLQHQR